MNDCPPEVYGKSWSSLQYHNQNYYATNLHLSIPICNPVICISHPIDLGHDGLGMDQDLPMTGYARSRDYIQNSQGTRGSESATKGSGSSFSVG